VSVFGFAYSNLPAVLNACEEVAGRDRVQFVSGRDTIINKRCHVVLGVSCLDPVRLASLNRSRSVLVVIDSAPALRRVSGIRILDVKPGGTGWDPRAPQFASLWRALRATPRPLHVTVSKDAAIAHLIEEVRTRGVLDSVLAAARPMTPTDRESLHTDVARLIAGELNVKTLRRRCERRGASGKWFEKMITAMTSETAKRLGKAVSAARDGKDAAQVAAQHRVDVSEVRFVLKHLK
jgi:hypothetical protein